jgi:hypothetical protein
MYCQIHITFLMSLHTLDHYSDFGKGWQKSFFFFWNFFFFRAQPGGDRIWRMGNTLCGPFMINFRCWNSCKCIFTYITLFKGVIPSRNDLHCRTAMLILLWTILGHLDNQPFPSLNSVCVSTSFDGSGDDEAVEYYHCVLYASPIAYIWDSLLKCTQLRAERLSATAFGLQLSPKKKKSSTKKRNFFVILFRNRCNRTPNCRIRFLWIVNFEGHRISTEEIGVQSRMTTVFDGSQHPPVFPQLPPV